MKNATIKGLTPHQKQYWGNIEGTTVEIVKEFPWSMGVDVECILNNKRVFIDKSQLQYI